MKKLILILGMIVATVCAATAQEGISAAEFKLQGKITRLEIFLGRVTVEGTDGNDILIYSKDRKDKEDERAKGLRAVSGLGLEDNTGQGVNVTGKDGGVAQVRQLKKMDSPDIRILVPKGVVIYYEYESQYGGTAKFKNLENEIEVSANYNSVELENVTGPVTAKSVYGHVEADFNNNVKGPISIVSVYGYVDVSLPVPTKADLKMSTSHGEIYAAQEFKIEYEKQSDNMVHYDNKVSGKINGGGMKIDLNSSYGKIYLRKK